MSAVVFKFCLDFTRTIGANLQIANLFFFSIFRVNRYIVTKSFYNKMPNWIPESGKTKSNFIKKLFNYLSKTTSCRDRLYYHNVICGTMSPQRFEYWWNNESLHNGHEIPDADFAILKEIANIEKVAAN